jgi:hypothetical protein
MILEAMVEFKKWRQNTDPRFTHHRTKKLDGHIQQVKMWTSEWGESMNAAIAETYQQQRQLPNATLFERDFHASASSSSNDRVQPHGSVAKCMSRSKPY